MGKRGDSTPQENKMTERTAQHTVRVTKNLGEERRKEIVSFINEHIAEYRGTTDGKTPDQHGMPLAVFDRQQDAHLFANEMSKRLDFPREHIEVKPRSNRVELNRADVIRQ
jgi:hypothetical protein